MRMYLLAATVLALGCNKSTQAPEPSAAPSARAPTEPAANPSPAAPAAAPAAAPPSAAADGPAAAGGLTWQAPSPFTRRTPKSGMRAAEYGVEGDASAELTVFYFGAGQGGSIDQNMSRWLSQFSQPDGSETKTTRSERVVNGVSVSLIEANGTFSGGMPMPGAAAPGPQADAMLLGAIAKGAQGPVFFKLVGPRATLERARSGFEGLVASLRAAP